MDQRKPKITADHFYKFFQCPHWIWFDIYEDAKRGKKVPPLLDIIYKGKIPNSEKVMMEHKKFEIIKPELFRDLDEAFMATLDLMRQGKNIYHGVLMYEDWVGMPDLLEARPGKSELGDWYYVAYDAQSSLDLRDESKFQLIFYSLILEKLQGVRPEQGYMIDPRGNEGSFMVNDFLEQFNLTLSQIEKILDGEKPAPFLKRTCKRTPWYSLCLSETEGCNDVSLIFKLSQADQRRLYEIGIRTVEEMAKADVDDLQSKLEDWPFDKLVRYSNQAKVLVSKEPIYLRKTRLPIVKNEVYFDIESDPLKGLDYLLGFVVKNTEKPDEVPKYQYCFAKDKSEEGAMWKKFLDFLADLDDFVIYHYAYYEKEVFNRLAAKYGAPQALVDKFKENTIDLHEAVVDSVVMPLYFYGLKDIAGYIGYKWDDPEAGGAESVVWFNDWTDSQDPEILKKILRYNEDDVRATQLIKEWLVDQGPRKIKEKLEE
ncbi:MAG: recombinase B [Candidatus Yanofskybacteria bacterium GW2011_GWF1_44_227]|uniref:Recombinase B n=1 Tax=Candidatus Yanofskybacteria bacterium GW2011_GWE2_40_11 TaxID=1619033 RepID=A0A0G0QKA2_9BACT|nr:MAG: recombinase B [Candidatus Yanofskybacteria bacterium GW2011_GWE1_40_10]KKR40844.1 MAG: recombinase B [Candidatus Yanofskybacteria bacterium GW2011_GWE2_40_11]KKT15959.1 MAG: recombinase B [Candidatus Yanofskybacteria bacterium GW2011_GWF2_43_596]KKT53527.1 MAG: recombinase B [Candidatus Yanofskybacteria bacterium GW2011_GWF1_44_227]OGN36051.1 MAG: hypothetical protein A2207_03265 [Candidatus Yanofskybacteria bacterium RIFOXYA1_FULL_44_17]OGN36347.1 MAG: hypothetical protein A2241_01220